MHSCDHANFMFQFIRLDFSSFIGIWYCYVHLFSSNIHLYLCNPSFLQLKLHVIKSLYLSSALHESFGTLSSRAHPISCTEGQSKAQWRGVTSVHAQRVMTTESLVTSRESDGYQWSRENRVYAAWIRLNSPYRPGGRAGITWWIQELLQDMWLLGMTLIWSNLKIQICLKSFTVSCQSVVFGVFINRRAANMGSNGGVMLRDSRWAEVKWQLKH